MHCTSGIVYRVSFTLSLTRGAVRSYNWPIGSIVIALCEARPQYDDAAKHCPPRELFPHLLRRGPPDPEKVIEAPHKSSSLSGFDSRECFSPAAAAALASRPLLPNDRPSDRWSCWRTSQIVRRSCQLPSASRTARATLQQAAMGSRSAAGIHFVTAHDGQLGRGQARDFVEDIRHKPSILLLQKTCTT